MTVPSSTLHPRVLARRHTVEPPYRITHARAARAPRRVLRGQLGAAASEEQTIRRLMGGGLHDRARNARFRRSASVAGDYVGLSRGACALNKGLHYPPDPPTMDGIVCVMRSAAEDRHSWRHRLAAAQARRRGRFSSQEAVTTPPSRQPSRRANSRPIPTLPAPARTRTVRPSAGSLAVIRHS
jgi:hypothetical protein